MTAHADALIEEMAVVLIDQVPELANDQLCMQELLKRFAPSDVFTLLDTARNMARKARTTEADLWWKLMNERDPE